MKKSTSKLLKKVLYMTGMLLVVCLLTVFCSVLANAETDNRIRIPNLPTDIRRPYANVDVFGIDMDAIDALFPDTVNVTYEDGKIIVDDIGAGTVTYSGAISCNLELVDGIWTADIGERTTSAEIIKFEYKQSDEESGLNWYVAYVDGIRDAYVHIIDDGIEYSIDASNDYMTYSYRKNDITVIDTYENGVLDTHKVSGDVDEVSTDIVYNADQSVRYISFYFYPPLNGRYYHYYYVGQGWSSTWGSYTPEDTPDGYEAEIDVDYYAEKLPRVCMDTHVWDNGVVTEEPNCSKVGTKTYTCIYDSAHTKTEDIDIVADAHSWDNGAVTEEPNCSEVGTRTYTCIHNAAHTRTEDIDIVADAHSWDNGAVTKEPTCTEKGTKTFTCTHNALHTRTEDIDSLGGHKYDNACDADCNVCSATRTPAAHQSENADGKCDVCGESFKLSGGEIAGIAVGSTALVGAGGFSLFWFVIKKKKWSDIFDR